MRYLPFTLAVFLALFANIVRVGFAEEIPHISSTSPAQNELNVPVSTDISVTFDKDMDETTINDSTFVVNAMFTGLHRGMISYNSQTRTAIFDPSSDFDEGEVVTVVLTTDIRSSQGVPLDSSYVWSFTNVVNDGAGAFVLDSAYPVGDWPTQIFAADLDGDGDLDLAIASGNVYVLLNNGDGTFSHYSAYPTDSGASSIFAADLDGDGDIDLATASRDVYVLLNNGDGTFAPYSTNQTSADWSHSIFAADLDGDGDLDLVTANCESNNVSVLLNNGDGTFGPDLTFPVSDWAFSVFAADLDGDGDLDLAITNNGSNDVSVLLNKGDGTFGPGSIYPVGDWPTQIFAADLDGDGDLDLATANNHSDDVSVLLNNGDGTFAPHSIYPVGIVPMSLFAGDLDGDGDLDLITANMGPNWGSGNVSVLLNNGDGTFAPHSDYPIEYHPWSVFAADLDGDGDLDLTTGTFGSDNVLVLLNQKVVTNKPPQILCSPDTIWAMEKVDTAIIVVTASDPDSGDLVHIQWESTPQIPGGSDGDSVTQYLDWTGSDWANPNEDTLKWTPGCSAHNLGPWYTISLIATDTSGLADTCQVAVYVEDLWPPFALQVKKVLAWPGEVVDVPVTLCNVDLVGAHDILIHWDCTLAELVDVEQKYYYVDGDSFQFEYFNWSSWQVDDGCKARIIGIANKPNQLRTPPISPGQDQKLFDLIFDVSSNWDPNYQIPIDFEVDDPCNDNTLSNQLGTQLWTAKERHYWQGTDYNVEGIPPCGSMEQPISLYGGKIEGEEIHGPYGDVNMDGIRYTIADAVYFMEYLKGQVELEDEGYQGTASDINRDGHQWTIADLIYLVNIINGGAKRPGGGAKVVVEDLNLIVKGNTVSVDKPVAGLYLVVDGGGEPVLRASGMQMETGEVNGERRIIIIGADWRDETATAVGNLVTIPGEFELREVQASDAAGYLMTAKVELIPTWFALHQNYPNPFNLTTRIAFDLPEDVDISLTVYNISGQKVAELVKGKVEAGHHTVTWDVRDISSGIYFYRIKTGDFTATRKMVLLK